MHSFEHTAILYAETTILVARLCPCRRTVHCQPSVLQVAQGCNLPAAGGKFRVEAQLISWPAAGDQRRMAPPCSQ